MGSRSVLGRRVAVLKPPFLLPCTTSEWEDGRVGRWEELTWQMLSYPLGRAGKTLNKTSRYNIGNRDHVLIPWNGICLSSWTSRKSFPSFRCTPTTLRIWNATRGDLWLVSVKLRWESRCMFSYQLKVINVFRLVLKGHGP